MADRTGQTFGNYQLTKLLGRGGFADVYLGEHRRLGTQSAIKILHTHLHASDETSFLTEARTIAHLEHPNIVRILDFDIQEGIPFLVMSYAPNGSLRQLHPKGTRLPASQVRDYLKQIATALQYAHDQKFIHRDIKPENILLGRHNELLLTDFGIALIAQSTRFQNTQDVIGTAHYMAPEQLQGKPRLASDQYALAIVLYEWLTGERPFGGTFLELYSQHLSVPPPPMREKVSTLSPDLDRVILTALAKDPAQRFGSIKAFSTAFEQALSPSTSVSPVINSADPTMTASPMPIVLPSVSSSSVQILSSQKSTFTPPAQIPPTTPISPITPPSRPLEMPAQESPRQRRGISRRAVIAGAALTVVGGIGIWLFSSFRRGEVGTSDVGMDKLVYIYGGHSNTVNALAWSPDGKRIASGGLDKTVQIWNATDGSAPYTYSGHTSSVFALAWSPDGKKIVSGSSDDTVQIWNATDGSALYTYSGHISSVFALAWSPDGTKIASGSSDGIVQVWNATDGSALYTYSSHSTIVTALAWSPDGKKIASGSSDGTVQIWNATDGSSPYIYRGHTNRVFALAWSPDSKMIASGSDDRTVQVWNATDGSSPYIYRGHTGYVSALTWSPDGKMIASGGLDKTVQVWNATDGSSPYTYKGHTGSVNALAWSPDGKMIASGSSDNTAQVWNAL